MIVTSFLTVDGDFDCITVVDSSERDCSLALGGGLTLDLRLTGRSSTSEVRSSLADARFFRIAFGGDVDNELRQRFSSASEIEVR